MFLKSIFDIITKANIRFARLAFARLAETASRGWVRAKRVGFCALEYVREKHYYRG